MPRGVFPRTMKHPIGTRFGRWVIVAEAGYSHNTRRVVAKCDCDTERVVSMSNFLNGNSRSCGCAPKAPKGSGRMSSNKRTALRRVKEAA